LIEVDAVVRDPDFVPCHPDGECWFVKHNASDPGGAEADMPAHDLILLNTLLHGILDEKHGSFADWKVCKLVEAFELSNGPRGNGWSCVQVSDNRINVMQSHVLNRLFLALLSSVARSRGLLDGRPMFSSLKGKNQRGLSMPKGSISITSDMVKPFRSDRC
jgi:hypothetical protein